MIQLENVSKIYRTRNGELKALDDVSLEVKKREFVVIRGPSGSGENLAAARMRGDAAPDDGAYPRR